MKRILIFFLLVFCANSCQKKENRPEKEQKIIENTKDSIFQTYNLNQLDSLLKVSVKSNAHHLAYKAYYYKYPILDDSLSKEKVEPYLDTLYNFAEKTNSDAYLAEANYLIGMHYFGKRYGFKKAYFHFNNAKKLFLELNDSLNIAKSMIRMASVQNKLGDFTGSQNAQINALNYLDLNEETNKRFLITGYNLLALSSSNQKDYESALKWVEKSMAINEYDHITPTLKNNKGMFLLKAGKFDESIRLFQELLKDSLVYKSVTRKARGLDNLGYAKLKSGDISGLKLISQSQKLLETNNYQDRYAAFLHLADYYKNKNKTKASENAIKALALVPTVDDRLEMYKILAISDINDKDLYLKKYIALNDSLVNARNKISNQFAKIRYDSELKEQQILKLENENAQKQLKLEKESYRQNLFKILIIFIVILIILGFYINKKKNEKNRNLAIYNLENKLSKRVHDEVANEVYMLMNKIEHQKLNSVHETLDHLENIYLRTRNISREFDSRTLLQNFHLNLLSLLSSFKSSNTNILIQNSSEEFWKPIPNQLKLNIYRILQEMLTNMKKHSHASVVVISFEKTKNSLTIKYKDDGKGFDSSSEILANGLQNIRSRIKELEGEIIFETLTKGSKILIKFHLK